MSKYRRYGRNQRRKHREQIALLGAQLAIANSWKTRAYEAEHQLSLIRSGLAQHLDASTCLPVREKVTYENPYMRVPVRRGARINLMEAENLTRAYEAMPVEKLMLVLLEDEDNAQQFQRRMHFRVLNAPGEKQAFRCGYAVTHTELHYVRSREAFVTNIGRHMAGLVWESLYGQTAKTS